jgi:hypothetical protein
MVMPTVKEKVMTRPMVQIGNEVRPMNDAEFAQHEIDQASLAAKKAEADAKAEAKAQLLDRLGITAEEAQLLLS